MRYYNPNQPSLELVALDMRNAKRQCKRPGRDIAMRQLMGELHEKKMMSKHFRNLELNVKPITHLQQQFANGKRSRPNMSDRTLAAHRKQGAK